MTPPKPPQRPAIVQPTEPPLLAMAEIVEVVDPEAQEPAVIPILPSAAPGAEPDGYATFTMPPGWTEAQIMDPTGMIVLLRYPDGEVWCQHPCKVVDDVIYIAAVHLTQPPYEGTIRSPGGQSEAKTTITPDITCPECSLHGRVVDSVWEPL